jgi:hypothetical protein
MRKTLPKPTDRLRIGKLRVSPFCLGMVKNPASVRAAYDHGINFFFLSADMHWPLYEGTRRGLRALLDAGISRDELVVAGTSYPAQPEFGTLPFREILEFAPWLKRVDVCVMGGSYAQDFFARLPVFERHKKTALAGTSAIGASLHERAAAVTALNHGLVDVAFIRYNPAHSGADVDVFPELERRRPRAPLFGFKSTYGCVGSKARYDALGLFKDNWRPDAVDYYRYALSSRLDGILCAPSTPAELKALVKGLERGPLSKAEAEYMRELGDLTEGRTVVDEKSADSHRATS